MPNQPDHKQSLQKKLADFEHACKSVGLKLTHQRLEIYRELAMSSDHPTVETIYARLKERLPTISLDTIYRSLTTLENHSLIRKVQTAESQTRFEAEMMQHHHFICNRCNKIMDFQWQIFDNSTLPDELSTWGQVQSKNVVLHGICEECLQKNNRN